MFVYLFSYHGIASIGKCAWKLNSSYLRMQELKHTQQFPMSDPVSMHTAAKLMSSFSRTVTIDTLRALGTLRNAATAAVIGICGHINARPTAVAILETCGARASVAHSAATRVLCRALEHAAAAVIGI